VSSATGSQHHRITSAVIGWGAWPGAIGAVYVTWPLAVLRWSEDGVVVDVRLGLLRWFARTGGSGTADGPLWSAGWSEITLLEVASSGKGVVLRALDERSCRFNTLKTGDLAMMVESATLHGVTPVTISALRLTR
jgi:hypothetical protein